MIVIKVSLKKRSYDIICGYDIASRFGGCLSKAKVGTDAYVVTNAKIKNKYGRTLEKALKAASFNVRFATVADTEKSKSIATLSSLIEDMAGYDKNRRLFIVAFGGGVIGDLAGFLAAIYKRGIPYVQVPTTLLAQVDSSIGGKTAVDLSVGKNLAGAFYQPRLVFSDVKLLKSLDKKQISAGLAEVIKYGLIKDNGLFLYLEKNYLDVLALKPKALEYIVTSCSKIKAEIVSKDELEEKGLRTILNFGHTVGHAIEAAGGYKMCNHGEAVSLGMLVALDISRSLGMLTEDLPVRVKKLMQAVGLPVNIQKIGLSDIINAHYRDKKFIGSRNRFVLLRGVGKPKIVESVPTGVIKDAIKKRFKA